MTIESLQSEHPWPHRLAVAMVCATFPLIWVGGLVTTHQAGMAVPDWPNTYGYNLFLYPPSTWLAGPFDLFIEHGHRLLGAIVGLLAIAFVIAVFRADKRPWLRTLAIVALLGVCVQGALGGMRVVLNERTLAMIHACVGPAFFAFTVALAAITSRRWRSIGQPTTHSNRIQRLALSTTALAYLQLILGAQLRHTPIDAGVGFFQAALYFHLLIAAALVAHIMMLALAAMRMSATETTLLGPALALLALIASQVSLGASTWVVKYGWPRWIGEYAWTAGYTVQREDFLGSLIITAHVAVGSLILGTSLLVVLRSWSVGLSPRYVKPIGHQLAEVAA